MKPPSFPHFFPPFPQPLPFTVFSTYLALAALPLALIHGLAISDPSAFSIELIDQSFNNEYAIANNVNSSLGFLSLTLPVEDGYTIELVNISDINDVYAQAGTFSVSEPVTVSSSASASSTGSASAGGSASESVSASASSGSASASASGSDSASASDFSTRASSIMPSTSSAACTASTSAFNAASGAQVGGAGILAAVLAWVAAI